jgi:hypothetical protein
LRHTDPWAKAGVMIRASTAAGSAHAFALVSAEAGYAFQRRGTESGESVHTTGGAGIAPGWVRLTRTGSTIEAFRSADGLTWTSIGRDTVSLGQTVLVGIAVTSHNESQSTVAVIDGLKVSTASVSSPPPPTSAPRAIAFTPSSDHTLLVDRYELEVFVAGATPGASTPVAVLNLGKPAVSDGEITVDCSAFFAALAPGSYQATVTAIGSTGSARSAAVAFSR